MRDLPPARKPRRQWKDPRELKEMRALYIDCRISAATVARLFKTTTTQVYRLARLHDWPHRPGGPAPDPRATRRLPWKCREIYRHMKPIVGHDAAVSEAWRGIVPAHGQGGNREGART